ncbi:hypothetical protein BN946_scf184980.g22 [Trametes cinnabarina]|uniref:Uncharacterized protein n=1 Tax=Pycnoporus cinnabarinus TaxID=5643 RepID=A0A060SJ64_PYCCI|nr:hypothetical protein BN946_scf184980.g19 [Trametes cinnabarina]CDO72481.1 hypothetical protein BN946_scf184980.g22 [Trametes cinnabarina]
MFTAIITFFLTVLGALRATSLYTGILTLSDGLHLKSWLVNSVFVPLLEDKTAANAVVASTGNGTRAKVYLIGGPWLLSLPAPPLILTLPPGFSDRALIVRPDYAVSEVAESAGGLDALLVLVGLAVTTYWVLKLILGLRASATVELSYRETIVQDFSISGKPYNGTSYQAGDSLVLAGIMETLEVLSSIEGPVELDLSVAKKKKSKRKGKKSKVTTSSSMPPSIAVTPVPHQVVDDLEQTAASTGAIEDPGGTATAVVGAASVTAADADIIEPACATPPPEEQPVETPLDTSAVEDEDASAWITWSNRRRQRSPRSSPPPSTSALSALSSRSSSVVSDARSTNSLFTSKSSASTGITSVASSRRSSIALPSPTKPLPPSSSRYRITIRTRTRIRTLTDTFDKPSSNKYSVLEAFEAEGSGLVRSEDESRYGQS